MADLILPIVHRNGTSQEALVEQRCVAGAKVREALEALAAMAPNGRDYYPEPGLLERAQAQHQRRYTTLRDLLAELQAEAEALVDVAETFRPYEAMDRAALSSALLANEANARLIAQAPEMLAALRMFFDAYKDHPERLGSGSSAAHQLLTKACAILRAVEG